MTESVLILDAMSEQERAIFNSLLKKDEAPQLLLETNMSRSYAGNYGYTVYEPMPNGELRLVGFVGEKNT
jgi:hypothetical protein